MTSRALWWQLLRIGLRAGLHAHGGRLRFMALITASTVMTIFFLSTLMVIASYDGRTQRFARVSVAAGSYGSRSRSRAWRYSRRTRRRAVMVVE